MICGWTARQSIYPQKSISVLWLSNCWPINNKVVSNETFTSTFPVLWPVCNLQDNLLRSKSSIITTSWQTAIWGMQPPRSLPPNPQSKHKNWGLNPIFWFLKRHTLRKALSYFNYRTTPWTKSYSRVDWQANYFLLATCTHCTHS